MTVPESNDALVRALAPEGVWKFFAQLSSVPRCSEHEDKIRDYIRTFARRRSLSFREDAAGNICVSKEATTGHANRPIVVVQGHLDMVCEKNAGTEHDFTRDPIALVQDGDWLRADGTTLGADNGIGVSMALALLDSKDLVHGPIEALFTSDEESGLVGATKMDGALVTGRTIINLDSEEEGIFYIGCAGGCNTEGWIPVQAEPAPAGIPGGIPVSVSVTGLRGGHSGVNIHEGRGNAIQLGARFLWHAAQEMPIRLYRAEGGGKHNAIPREFFAGVIVAEDDADRFETLAYSYAEIFRRELGDIEPGLAFSAKRSTEQPARHLIEESTDRILASLYTLPDGVFAMSRVVPGMVESSTNLAAISLSEHEAHILTSQRGSLDSETQDLSDRVKAVVEHAGGRIKVSGAYPGWPPEPSSPLMTLCKKRYRELYAKDPVVTAVHAGLECGVLREKLPGSMLISFGPDIEGAHTPEERVSISSTNRLWLFLLEILAGIE